MENQEGLSTNREPWFDGSNYTFWKIQMEVYLEYLGIDIWKSVDNGYKFPNVTTVEPGRNCWRCVHDSENRSSGTKG